MKCVENKAIESTSWKTKEKQPLCIKLEWNGILIEFRAILEYYNYLEGFAGLERRRKPRRQRIASNNSTVADSAVKCVSNIGEHMSRSSYPALFKCPYFVNLLAKCIENKYIKKDKERFWSFSSSSSSSRWLKMEQANAEFQKWSQTRALNYSQMGR